MNKHFLLFLLVLSASCKSLNVNIFSKKSPHEAYEEKLDDKGLANTPEGRAWLAASKSAIANAQDIALPYQHHGYFNANKSSALGLSFYLKQGERINIKIEKQQPSGLQLFADVFGSNNNADAEPLFSADGATNDFSFDAETSGDFILRLQPQLKNSGSYKLIITKGPSLLFPVSGTARVGSFWGAARDGGRRKHEGIDIFAARRTPVVAAADGVITGVRDGGIGGKTVWLRPADKNITLYYAHLDEQLVREGQMVKKGETVGLVGNTGNAKNTPAHLHFGIYTFSGAVDPLPFVNKEIKMPAAIPAKDLGRPLKLTKDLLIKGQRIQQQDVITPLAANAKGYIAQLEDGTLISLSYNAVKTNYEKERHAAVRSLVAEVE